MYVLMYACALHTYIHMYKRCTYTYIHRLLTLLAYVRNAVCDKSFKWKTFLVSWIPASQSQAFYHSPTACPIVAIHMKHTTDYNID